VTDNASSPWNDRYLAWLRYLTAVTESVNAGQSIPLGPSPDPLVPPQGKGRPRRPAKVIYCAPHPDDECLCGGLALRLKLEAGARVTNVAVTLGSDASQKERRRRELESACRALGFDLVVPQAGTADAPLGFDRVNKRTRDNEPDEWEEKVRILSEIFDREKPDVVFAPHDDDFNTTHVGTHYLAFEALGQHIERNKRRPLPLVETEFWHQLAAPNLMVGLAPETVAMQLVAATEHGGEMTRNPYHLLHAGRLMDGVRRGSEVVGGQGAAAQPFTFAELYRVIFVRGREILGPQPGGLILNPSEPVDLAKIVARFRTQGSDEGRGKGRTNDDG